MVSLDTIANDLVSALKARDGLTVETTAWTEDPGSKRADR